MVSLLRRLEHGVSRCLRVWLKFHLRINLSPVFTLVGRQQRVAMDTTYLYLLLSIAERYPRHPLVRGHR